MEENLEQEDDEYEDDQDQMEEEKNSSALEHMTEPIVNKSLRKTNDMAHQ